jgi:creatinine amidohydrolase/Fe(II)-dependent formamide hydrolase-like protein
MGIVPRRITNKVGLSGKEDYFLFIEDDANPIPFTAFTKTQDMHAGSLETSFMQRFHPNEVNLEIAKDLKPTIFESKDWKGWANGWSDARKVIPYGCNGDPATLNPQLAEAYIIADAASITQVILSSL